MIAPSVFGFSIGLEVDPTLTVLWRKVIVAMVVIDVVDGGFCAVLTGLIAGRPAPTGFDGV
jgi:hypothetical protein